MVTLTFQSFVLANKTGKGKGQGTVSEPLNKMIQRKQMWRNLFLEYYLNLRS